MLSSDYLFDMTDKISEYFEELNTSIINDMARRIIKMDYVSSSTAWQIQRTIESGELYDDIIKKLSIQTSKTETELKRLFKEAGEENWINNLDKAGLQINENDTRLSQGVINTLAAGLNKTNGILKNMVMTTAINTQNEFIHAIDLAYKQVASGAFDYQTIIRRTVKKLATDGVSVINYASGKKIKIDSAVRMLILTGISQTTGQITEMQANEVGANGYETTAHSGARQSHEIWQGKQFYKDIPVKGYEEFKTATGYGQVDGLKGVNCRHDFFFVFLPNDKPSYTKSELKSLNDQNIEYNGKKMSIYEAQQNMRNIERNVREWKRQSSALKASGLDNSFEKNKVKQWTDRYKDFTNKTGLKRQNERLVVHDIEKGKNNINVTKTNKDDIIKQILKPIDFNIDDYIKKITKDNYFTNDNITKTMGRFNNNSDLFLKKLLEEKGFDALPVKMNSHDFELLDSEKYIKVKRGIKTTENITAKQMKDNFINGDLFVGKGNFGNGTYTAVNQEIANNYGDTIIDIAIPKDANIISFEDIMKDKQLIETDGDITRKIYSYDNKTKIAIERSLSDVSKIAVQRNYDIIEVPPGYAKQLLGNIKLDFELKSYYIILNRGKIIVKE